MPVEPELRALLGGFLTEARALAEKATRALLGLEQAADAAALLNGYRDIARCLHTLKGSAATLGLDGPAELAHAMEDVVVRLRKGGLRLPPTTADGLLHGLDAFIASVLAEIDGSPPSDLGPVVAGLRPSALQEQREAPAPAPAPAPSADAPPRDAPDEQEAWKVGQDEVLSLLRQVERLREVRLRLEARRRDLLRESEALSRLGLASGNAELRGALLAIGQALGADAEEVAATVDALEEGVKSICTLPVRTTLQPLYRMVRDLARAKGKEVTLSAVGAEVSLDRRVLEAMKGPLLHLVRNAVDHGIEAPQVREQHGKHRAGALVVRVERQGNMVFLEVSDDGAGLDPELIRAAALEHGLESAAELAAMDLAGLQQLIFRSGFSTRKEVTQTSGRGVGLDVVRSAVQAARGHVEVHSIVGQGTRFLLGLPTELGSSPVLLVRCGEQTLGLPLLLVETTVAARAEALRLGSGPARFAWRDQLLPLVDLGARLQLRTPQPPVEGQPVLVLSALGRRVALVVDAIEGDLELLVRPLPFEVRDLACYQGAAMLARGELALMLRPDWLVQSEGARTEAVPGGRRALVVDDSLTARALHRAMLEAGGFEVHAVASGRQGLEQLARAAYQVIVCDVAMEGMDGFAFTAAVRAQARLRGIPVVLVTAHDEELHRDGWRVAGADQCLSKSECAAGRLLAEVNTLIARSPRAP